jgi:hypothetical protein
MTTNSLHEILSVTTLDELLACNGQQFVRSAFQTILGREPDPEGLAYYIARLRAGYSKMRTVQQLRLSKEGFANEVRLPGLDASINRYKRGQYIAIGWLFRLLDGTESNHPTQRKLRGMENQLWLLSHATAQGFHQIENTLANLQPMQRAIENQLSLLSEDNNHRLNQIEKTLTGLHTLVVQQAETIVAALGDISRGSLNNAPVVSISQLPPDGLKHISIYARTISPLEPDGLKHISVYARTIYFQLKTAAAIHGRKTA